MVNIQKLVTDRLASKTKVVLASSPGYASMQPALQFVYAVLALIAESSELRRLMAAPNRGLSQRDS